MNIIKNYCMNIMNIKKNMNEIKVNELSLKEVKDFNIDHIKEHEICNSLIYFYQLKIYINILISENKELTTNLDELKNIVINKNNDLNLDDMFIIKCNETCSLFLNYNEKISLKNIIINDKIDLDLVNLNEFGILIIGNFFYLLEYVSTEMDIEKKEEKEVLIHSYVGFINEKIKRMRTTLYNCNNKRGIIKNIQKLNIYEKILDFLSEIYIILNEIYSKKFPEY